MTIPFKGSRRIVVDGTAYRWRIRRKPTRIQADYGCGSPLTTHSISRAAASRAVPLHRIPLPVPYAALWRKDGSQNAVERLPSGGSRKWIKRPLEPVEPAAQRNEKCRLLFNGSAAASLISASAKSSLHPQNPPINHPIIQAA